MPAISASRASGLRAEAARHQPLALLHQERGILVAQLVATYLHIQKYCEAEGWTDWQGNSLEPRMVTL